MGLRWAELKRYLFRPGRPRVRPWLSKAAVHLRVPLACRLSVRMSVSGSVTRCRLWDSLSSCSCVFYFRPSGMVVAFILYRGWTPLLLPSDALPFLRSAEWPFSTVLRLIFLVSMWSFLAAPQLPGAGIVYVAVLSGPA